MKIEKFVKIRQEEFPLTEKCAYLDTATTGMLSTKSKNAMVNFIENRYEEGMDIDAFTENWRHADRLRSTVARVLNSSAEEIFFSSSASEMLNVFSSGIGLEENSNVVTTDLSFPSTPYNWINRVGKENVRIASSENGQLPCEKLFALTDENTAVIALCMVENTSGWYHDIETIGAFCKERGIFLVLDVTQCIGAMNIDVQKMHIDFLTAATYKWLSGAFGVGFSYVSKRVLDQIRPTYVGWTGNKDRHNHSRYQLDLADGANRFETGSLNWIGLRGIEQSMALYLDLGKQDVEEYILGLTDYLYERLEALPEVGLVGPFPKKNRSGITYITFPKEWKLDDQILKENGIRAHVAGETKLRVAMHLYNNRTDIDQLISFFKTKL